jgi:hypothetical protein
MLVEVMAYRKGKMDTASLLYSRAIDPAQYGDAVLDCLGSDADRQALMEIINPVGDESGGNGASGAVAVQS